MAHEASSAAWRQAMAAVAPAVVRFDVPLADWTAFRIGGCADAVAEPRTAEEAARLLAAARQAGVPVTVLGAGTNVLVADSGVRGLVVRLGGELARVTVEEQEVRAGAAATGGQVVKACHDAGLVGLEFLATIPGTVGGALRMNAGAHGSALGDAVAAVTLISAAGVLEERPADRCGFGYRSSAFLPGDLLLGCRLRVAPGTVTTAQQRLQSMRRERRARQPVGYPSAGSVFKNPPGWAAGQLIEAVGLKGSRVGDAEISPVHANFIVNRGQASAADVRALIARAQQRVLEEYGITLELEVQLLGEWR